LAFSTDYCSFAAKKKRDIMLGKLPVDDHRELFRTRMADLINPKHEFALLANKIDRKYFEDEFWSLYSDKPSRPSMPIRFMVGSPMLKHLYNLGDERIPEYWVRDVYFQYFCGGVFFEH
jgi:IS5 family transposase